MATTPPNFNPGGPNQPYDPTNVNDPRYDPSRDPRLDPRWQKAQQRFYRDQQRAAQGQDRAAQKAQAAVWKQQARAQKEQWKMYWRAQRRTSIVGPLLLIAIGVIFFLIHTGRISPFGFFAWYGHWWPLLLIVVGVLRLAEWGIDRARAPQDAPPMRYTVGGGVVATVVVLALVGLAVRSGAQWRNDGGHFGFFSNGDGVEHLFGQKHEEDSPAVMHDVAEGAALSIDSPHGDVTISGTSDDGKLHLSVHKEVFTNSDDTASERLRELTPTLEGSNDNLMLRVPAVQGGGVDVTLLVPASVRVTLNSNRGDVHVTNLKSPVTATANNGDVEVAAITGAVQLHANSRRHDLSVRSVTGDVTVDGSGNEVNMSDIDGAARVNGDFFGGGHLQRVTGGVTYHSSRTDLSLAHLNGELQIDGNDLSASEVVGPVRVSTRSRNITLDKVTGDINVSNNHGDVDIHGVPPTGSITVDNQSGNVNVTVPDKSKFTLRAETTDGDSHSDFAGVSSDGRGTVSGAVNGGGPQVRVNTSHGDINISRNSGTPLPQIPALPKVTGFGSVGVPTPPMPPNTPDTQQLQQMQRDAMTTAAQALRESAQNARESTRASTDEARERAREAMEQAREAMRDARDKQREADRLAREAAKNR